MGACEALGGNVLTDAFGIVAMVAMTPLITIQILGLRYRFRQSGAPEPVPVPAEEPEPVELDWEDEIVELPTEEGMRCV
jgi:hypothetical protein